MNINQNNENNLLIKKNILFNLMEILFFIVEKKIN